MIPSPTAGHETLARRVREWLDKDERRRIILLLDEADAFLASDSTQINDTSGYGYPTLSHLKGMMDDNGQRFKVVFAGLHNVRRTSQDVNTPVAHLGTPLCVGPLLEDGEWEEARRLIELPFRRPWLPLPAGRPAAADPLAHQLVPQPHPAVLQAAAGAPGQPGGLQAPAGAAVPDHREGRRGHLPEPETS